MQNNNFLVMPIQWHLTIKIESNSYVKPNLVHSVLKIILTNFVFESWSNLGGIQRTTEKCNYLNTLFTL